MPEPSQGTNRCWIVDSPTLFGPPRSLLILRGEVWTTGLFLVILSSSSTLRWPGWLGTFTKVRWFWSFRKSFHGSCSNTSCRWFNSATSKPWNLRICDGIALSRSRCRHSELQNRGEEHSECLRDGTKITPMLIDKWPSGNLEANSAPASDRTATTFCSNQISSGSAITIPLKPHW